MPLDVETLKAERDQLKTRLRELEVEHRQTEASLKTVRQHELQVKREIEALTTLIEIHERRQEDGDPPADTAE